MARKAFPIHSDFFGVLRSLSSEQRGDILLALMDWASDAETPPLDPACDVLFRLMMAQQERLSAQNSENGRRGGAPVGNRNAAKTTETTENKRNKATITVTKTKTVTDTITNESTGDAGAPPPTPKEETR